MRTNIVLDDKLVEDGFKYSQAKTKRELINIALEEFVARKCRLNLMELRGKIEFEEDYDYKKMRQAQ